MKDWYIEGIAYGNCNCAYGCPCQFEAEPTHGNCRGFEVIRIDKGHFEEIDLSGLKVAMLYAWPGLISDGNGEMQAVIDVPESDIRKVAILSVHLVGDSIQLPVDFLTEDLQVS